MDGKEAVVNNTLPSINLHTVHMQTVNALVTLVVPISICLLLCSRVSLITRNRYIWECGWPNITKNHNNLTCAARSITNYIWAYPNTIVLLQYTSMCTCRLQLLMPVY